MSLLSSLDSSDRKILFWSLGIAMLLAVAAGVITPSDNGSGNPVPSTYLSGVHGARAAYETLLRSGYSVERWERPLSELVPSADENAVLVLAQPYTREAEDFRAIREFAEKGGRVIATGYLGGLLLPLGRAAPPPQFDFSACRLEPEGLDPLASSGEVWMVPSSTWQVGIPAQRTQYDCVDRPAVVEYDYGKGHLVWWASSTPLENASLDRAHNLDLLLNSIGPKEGRKIYWDESLHGDIRSNWSYVGGPTQTILLVGMGLLAVLLLFSFSRRSGPLREVPPAPRAAPVEFLDALGSLYRKAGASSTAVGVAFERFRRRALRLCGLRQGTLSAAELAEAIRRRFPMFAQSLEQDLQACEDAAANEKMEPRAALKVIQALYTHQEMLNRLVHAGPQDSSVQSIFH